MVIGSVNNTSTGLTSAFKMPRVIATISAVTNESTLTPGNTYDKIRMATDDNSKRSKNLI